MRLEKDVPVTMSATGVMIMVAFRFCNVFLAISSCVVLLLGGGCLPAKDPIIEVLAFDVEALTDAHTRVVWVQDTHALTDVFARGDALRLMGYDSRDGIGERVLLAGPDNFSKPMFVADGSRIIYSNVSDGYVYGVDWGGETPFRLVQGRALAVWRDAGKVDWVYVGTEPADSRAPAYHRVTRYQIGRPAVFEPVWQGPPVGEDSFQLSADGRLAGGNFPWPECGILHLAEQRIEHLGRGCWTSLAPDNSYRFWIFDGSHRNLLLFDTVADTRQSVSVSTAPGIDGHEAYHPRWSNHPRYMAMTGPYKIRSGGNNIRGGGADVEIFLGRFRADFGAIEQWVQLTDNPYANFFPDVWVGPVAGDTVASTKVASVARAERSDMWPRSRDGLVYLWEHGAAQNEIVKAAGPRVIFRPEARGMARYGAHHTMWVDKGYFVDTAVPSFEGDFTVEMVVHGLAGDARLLDIGDVFSLTVEASEWVVRAGMRHYVLGQVVVQPSMHVVVGVERNRLTIHVNGEHLDTLAWEQSISVSDADALYWGGHPEKGFLGPDRLSHMALYARVLDAPAVARHAAYFRSVWASQVLSPPEVVRARVVAPSGIPSPADIAPYRRALVFHEYEIIMGERAGDRLLAAHWAILDGKILEHAARPLGSEHDLKLVLFDARPELEGERVAMDHENFVLDWYYDLNL